jgi:uncharacterized membrane protein
MDALPADAELFLRKLRQGLRALPPADREEIVAEIRSHLQDRQQKGQPLLEGFEDPEAYAATFVSEAALRGALARGASLELGRALLTSARSGFFMLLTVVPLLAVQLVGVGLVICGVLKPFMPSHVGLFLDAGGRLLVLGASSGPSAREVLGWWSMPLFLFAGVLLLFVGNRALRALARGRLR